MRGLIYPTLDLHGLRDKELPLADDVEVLPRVVLLVDDLVLLELDAFCLEEELEQLVRLPVAEHRNTLQKINLQLEFFLLCLFYANISKRGAKKVGVGLTQDFLKVIFI